MTDDDLDWLTKAIHAHEAEIMLLRQWVFALLDAHPNRDQVIERFRNEASHMASNAPKRIDQEMVVEMQARLLNQLAALRKPFDPIR